MIVHQRVFLPVFIILHNLTDCIQDTEARAEASEVEALGKEIRSDSKVDPATELQPPFKPIMKEDETEEDVTATDEEIKKFFTKADQVGDTIYLSIIKLTQPGEMSH